MGWKMMDGTSQGRQSLCFVPAPPCPPQSTSEGYLSQQISKHRNPECSKPAVSMPIKVQRFREPGTRAWLQTGRQFGTLTRAFVTQAVFIAILKPGKWLFPVLRGHRWNIWCREGRWGLGALQKIPSKIQPPPVAYSCKKKDHCPLLSQSCPPDVAIPWGVHIFYVLPTRNSFLPVEEAGEDLAPGLGSLWGKKE